MQTTSLNLVSFPPWKLLKFSLYEGHSGHPISQSQTLAPRRLLLYLWSLRYETSPVPSVCSLYIWAPPWWTDPTLLLTSSHAIICDLKALGVQSPVYTCPLVLCTWTGPLTTSQLELVLQPLLPVPYYCFLPGTFLTFYGCNSMRLKPRTLSSLWLLFPWCWCAPALRWTCCLYNSWWSSHLKEGFQNTDLRGSPMIH